MKQETAAQRLGLTSRRFNGRLYPTPEQAATLLEQAQAVRQVQNAVLWRIRATYERKYGPYVPAPEGAPKQPRVFCCQCPGEVTTPA